MHIGLPIIAGAVCVLAYLWWEFQNAPLVDDEDEDYGSWNDER